MPQRKPATVDAATSDCSADRTRSFRMGEMTVDPPLVLAPMAAITDVTYRSICRSMGATLCVTEAAYAHRLLDNDEFTWQLTEPDIAGQPLLTQLYGKDPATMAAASERLARAGAQGIDINCGCPMPKIVKKGIGAALLQTPTQLAAIVASIRAAVDLPVTVKIRAGWASSNAVEIGRHIEAAGGAAISIHGRTREDRYDHHADLDVIAELKQSISIPVIGNGDVNDVSSARHMLEYTACDGVMVGRAAIGNPWIFREIRAWMAGGVIPHEPDVEERQSVMLEHLERAWTRYGDRVTREFRKHLLAYVRGLGPAESHVRSRLGQMETIQALRSLIDESCALMDADN